MDKQYISQLYHDGGLTNMGVLQAITMGWITTEDAVDILGLDNSLSVVRSAKLLEISKACNTVIVSGVDVQITSIWHWKTRAISTTCSAW